MALKKTHYRHIVITGTLDQLNENLTKVREEGWEYVDSKVLQSQVQENGTFQIFYILRTAPKSEKDG